MVDISPTIFIVDDDAAVRKSLQRLLRASGFQTEPHADADSYLQRPPHTGVGCMILDVKMPVMNGMDLQQHMTSRGDDLPIIFLTGHGDIPMSVAAIKAGAADFLTKPVVEGALLKAVRTALKRHAGQRSDAQQRREILARIESLSQREHEVLRCVIGGALNKQIAAHLGITEKTVKAHRGRVTHKMKAKSVAELIHACAIAGIEAQKVLD